MACITGRGSRPGSSRSSGPDDGGVRHFRDHRHRPRWRMRRCRISASTRSSSRRRSSPDCRRSRAATRNPLEGAVVSVTQIHAAIPGTSFPTRSCCAARRAPSSRPCATRSSRRMRRVAEGTAASLGATVEMRYERRYPPTVNSAAETEIAATAAADLVGADKVRPDLLPSMGAEDLPGSSRKSPAPISGSATAKPPPNLHNPHYDFNDDILPLGASYWVRWRRACWRGETPYGRRSSRRCSPSPNRLHAITVRKNHRARIDREPGAGVDQVLRVAQHAAPARERGLDRRGRESSAPIPTGSRRRR